MFCYMKLHNNVIRTIYYVTGVCRVAQWKVAKSIKKARCAGTYASVQYMMCMYM